MFNKDFSKLQQNCLTPLIKASREGKADIVKLLLEKNAAVNNQTNEVCAN